MALISTNGKGSGCLCLPRCQRQQSKLMYVRFRTKGAVLCGQGYCMLQTFTWVQKTKWNWVKWNKNMSPNTEKSLSKHTGGMPVYQDSAHLHPAGSISLECVSVWSLWAVAEDPELKDRLVLIRLLFHFFCWVWEARVQKSSVVRFTQF